MNISFPEWETNYKRLGNSGLFSLAGNTNIGKEKVLVKKFDDLDLGISSINKNYTIVKIDVEGFEFEVLKGMKRFLSSMKIIIKLEFNKKAWNSTNIEFKEFIDFIDDLNYETYIYKKDRFIFLDINSLEKNLNEKNDLELILIN